MNPTPEEQQKIDELQLRLEEGIPGPKAVEIVFNGHGNPVTMYVTFGSKKRSATLYIEQIESYLDGDNWNRLKQALSK